MEPIIEQPIAPPIQAPTAAAPRLAAAPISAFTTGLADALRYWPALLAMFMGTLLAAGLLSLVPAVLLYRLVDNPIIAEVADGIDAWQVVDVQSLLIRATGGLTGGDPIPSPAGLQGGLAALIGGALLLPFIGGVVSAFLWGGVLLTYREAPAPFRLGRFLWGCWNWFGAFLLLGFLQAIFFLLVPLTLISIFFWAAGLLGNWAFWLALFLSAGVITLWLALFELARVHVVTLNTRNPFAGFGRALGLLFRRPLPLLGYYALAVLLLLVIHGLFRIGLLPTIPLGLFPVAFIAQQVFIFARLFARAARLAGLVRMTGG